METIKTRKFSNLHNRRALHTLSNENTGPSPRTNNKNKFQSGKIKNLCSIKSKHQLNQAIKNSLIHRPSQAKLQKLYTAESWSRRLSFPTKKNHSIQVVPEDHSDCIVPREMLVEVKQIYNLVEDLKKLDFTEKRIACWVAKLVSKNSQSLSHIFMKISVNERSLNDCLIYERVTKVANCIQKLRMALRNASESKKICFMNEIRELKYHLEEILIKKNLLRAEQTARVFQSPNNQTVSAQVKPPSSEVAHFITDLKNIEERYGRLNFVQRVSRERFEQISRVEQTLHHIYIKSKQSEKLSIKAK